MNGCELEEPLVLAGDFNVIPSEPPTPATRPPGQGDALFLPQTRAKFRALCNLGLTDAVRAGSDGPRPLHLLGLSGRRLAEEQRHPHRPSAAVAAGRRPAASRAGIDKHVRAWEKPSDHVPVWADFDGSSA